MSNQLYAIHFKGELLDRNIWKKYSENYGQNYLQGWKPPKRIYFTLGYAKVGLSHLPKEIRKDCEIVLYVPASEIPFDEEQYK